MFRMRSLRRVRRLAARLTGTPSSAGHPPGPTPCSASPAPSTLSGSSKTVEYLRTLYVFFDPRHAAQPALPRAHCRGHQKQLSTCVHVFFDPHQTCWSASPAQSILLGSSKTVEYMRTLHVFFDPQHPAQTVLPKAHCRGHTKHVHCTMYINGLSTVIRYIGSGGGGHLCPHQWPYYVL